MTISSTASDRHEQAGRAWIAAQEVRLLYREPSRDRAERRLLRWLTDFAEHEIPELVRLARTLDAWRPERPRLPQLRQLRLRLLLHCGVEWNTPTVTPIRGRLPRLAA